jgi:hypothetical protein
VVPKKVAFTWEMLVICCGVHHTGGCFRKARGPHGGPKKESPPGRTDLVLPGIEVDLDVAQPLLLLFVKSTSPYNRSTNISWC